MTHTSAQLLRLVNDFIEPLPTRREPATLYDPIRYVLSMGGKRIRPVLALMAYELYRDDPQTILPQACALETYHNYTLLHDDLMDQAPLRRGMPTVHTRWDANTAILSGDSMLVLAYQLMAEGTPRCLPDILDLFTTTALEIGEGQQMDMDFEQRDDVTVDEYIEMIRLKTSVLLACALKTGALLAGASATDADCLYRFGERVGLAFQLQDDYLDVYGNPDIFGKAVGGDILSNKKTFMLINAFEMANEKQREALRQWIDAAAPDPKRKVEEVTRLYDEIGIKLLAEEKIADFYAESRRILERLSVPEERKATLLRYTDEMMHRKQ